jgi:hypothetical protein
MVKPIADIPLVPLVPNGSKDPRVLAHMTRFGSLFLERGSEFLNASHVDTVYTAIFEGRKSGFEVGVYGFRFSQQMEASSFHITENPTAGSGIAPSLNSGARFPRQIQVGVVL